MAPGTSDIGASVQTVMRIFAVGFLVVVLPLGAGCSDDDDVVTVDETESDDTSATVTGPLLRYPGPPNSGSDGDAALIEGELVLEDGCLYVVGELERFPVVWPAGTTWNAESETVVSPSTGEMPVGSAVSGGGGYSTVEEAGRRVDAGAERLAEECVDNSYGEVAFLNNGTDSIGPAE